MVTEKRISEKLRQMGIPANLKGFAYIKTAVILVGNDDSYLHAITKRLYPDIATQYNTMPNRVERAIRHAIEQVFTSGNLKELEMLGTTHWRSGKLTNGGFIGALYECLRYENV